MKKPPIGRLLMAIVQEKKFPVKKNSFFC